jgi:hypothetical protein
LSAPPDFVRRSLPLIAAFGIAAAASAVFFLLILRATGGRLIYGLDDAYIHLAIAKHIAQNGVWGVTPFGFSSSSSSILWPLLLAGAFKLFGAREIIPFVFALAAAAGLMAVLYREWTRRGDRPGWALGMLIAWMLLLPLGPILFNGMETMLQALVSVALAAVAVRFLADEKTGRVLPLCLLAALASAIRYEGCFIAASVCLLLVFRGRWKAALPVALSAAVPVIVFGMYSLSQGWSFLPNSVLIKHSVVDTASPAGLWTALARPFQAITDINVMRLPLWQSLAVIVLMMLLLRARTVPIRSLWDDRLLPAVLFLMVAVLHSFGIASDWFFRYQAYLNALGIWAIGCAGIPGLDFAALRRHAAAAVAAVCAAILVAVPLADAAVQAVWKTPLASRNIWQQQYQMGLFLKANYPQEAVAANDIGAIDFLDDLRLTDLSGLASRAVMRAEQNGSWQRDLAGTLDALTSADGVQIAVIYDNWFDYNPATGRAAVPPDWVRVAEWTIPDNVVCGGATVTWYAVDPQQADGLRSALEQFAAELPAGVAVRYDAHP